MTETAGSGLTHTIEVLAFLLATSPLLTRTILAEVTEVALRVYINYEQRTEEERQAYIYAVLELRRLATFIISRTEDTSQEL